jgi:hypothetical protein
MDMAYRQMLMRLNKSLSFEMKAWLRALQSQMNPHSSTTCCRRSWNPAREENSPRTVAMS